MPDSPSAWLRSLAAEATPGPWSTEALGSEGYGVFGARDNGLRRHRITVVGHGKWDDDKADARLIALAPDLAVLCADAIDLIAPDAEDACDDPGCESFSCHAAALLARFAALQPDNTEEGT